MQGTWKSIGLISEYRETWVRTGFPAIYPCFFAYDFLSAMMHSQSLFGSVSALMQQNPAFVKSSFSSFFLYTDTPSMISLPFLDIG